MLIFLAASVIVSKVLDPGVTSTKTRSKTATVSEVCLFIRTEIEMSK